MIRTGMIAAAVLSVASMASAAITLTPKVGFGGADGWLAPNDNAFLLTANNERGMAYNPVTGNVLLHSRSNVGAGNAATIRVLSGTTGAELSSIPLPSATVAGGTFPSNMIGVADDGAIYVANLASAATANFRVYRIPSEGAGTVSVAHSATIPITGNTPRLGDSFDVIGSGTSTKLVASGSGTDGYAVFSTTDGLAYTASYVNVAGDSIGDYRLGITFGASDNKVIGTQGGNPTGNVRFTTVSPAALDATGVVGKLERPIDFAVVGGLNILATLEASNDIAYAPTVRVYDVTNPAAPVLLASALNAVGPFVANANGVGSIKFGAISGGSVDIYAMSTNSGIQAFTLTIPEPATLGLLAGAGILALRRRA